MNPFRKRLAKAKYEYAKQKTGYKQNAQRKAERANNQDGSGRRGR